MVKSFLAARKTLGANQDDPFASFVYTDDFDFFTPCDELTTKGGELWRTQMNEMNVWMSAKVGAGTVIDSIGGRFVLNGGYSCLVPNKKTRCITECKRALGAEGITRDELISTTRSSFTLTI